MSRVPVPLVAPDLSRFARALGRALNERQASSTQPPGHLELMNLLARAAGHRNLQSLQAQAQAMQFGSASPPSPAPSTPTVALLASEPAAPARPTATALKALGCFDDQGRLVRWPTRWSVQRLAMWALWMRFDGKRRYSEREVNEILRHAHTYGDHATLRRELINHRLMARESDCSAYWKLPARADDETRAFLQAWRRGQRGSAVQ